jgi:hypothetical protein
VTEAGQDGNEKTDLRAHQAGLSAEASHSGEDGSMGYAKSGFTEVDLVSHSGNSASGEFARTLNVTDIHATWTEFGAVLGRGEEAVQRALNEIAGVLPFRLLGVDSDNGSEFIDWHLQHWCEQKEIQLTRGRPYKKDDNAPIEQKNWTHVRKLLGWERYDTHETVEAINDLYRKELRLRLNLFLPVKLFKKVGVGSKVRRVYDGPRTPCERVRACPQADREQVAWLEELRKRLDPFALARTIERKLERIYRLANRRLSSREVQESAVSRRGKGCGKDARSASVEIKKRFSRNMDGRPFDLTNSGQPFMRPQNPTAKERSSTVLRFASFPPSILKRSGGASRVEMNALRAPLTPLPTSAGDPVGFLWHRFPHLLEVMPPQCSWPLSRHRIGSAPSGCSGSTVGLES